MGFTLQLRVELDNSLKFLLTILMTKCLSVFQKVVERELDALLEQQNTIESKMVTLHRMG